MLTFSCGFADDEDYNDSKNLYPDLAWEHAEALNKSREDIIGRRILEMQHTAGEGKLDSSDLPSEFDCLLEESWQDSLIDQVFDELQQPVAF